MKFTLFEGEPVRYISLHVGRLLYYSSSPANANAKNNPPPHSAQIMMDNDIKPDRNRQKNGLRLTSPTN